ncbi:hypothetical protein E3N88_45748 [Mikania micrantha]|uniref:Uncharacterized protein n=1 Tax=Mikania micrantha TaxID=192012 RepID=A0A5N6L874_9ASTR|nr:hypothetical protein E3N88_45750 [Mikania micrantha]KAC9488812.1 hypothetical protein E3N88_45748 [Mikania micrantha]
MTMTAVVNSCPLLTVYAHAINKLGFSKIIDSCLRSLGNCRLSHVYIVIFICGYGNDLFYYLTMVVEAVLTAYQRMGGVYQGINELDVTTVVDGEEIETERGRLRRR